jgi:taurine dioxygenase
MPEVVNISSQQITSSVGAVLNGFDLRRSLRPDEVQFIHRALLEHGVVFFHDQDLTNEQMHAFVSNFGTPVPEPFAEPSMRPQDPVSASDLGKTKRTTAVWHADTTFVPDPPMGTALRAVKLPPVGGDTCWSSMYAAYEALSPAMQRFLDGLTAIHSIVPVLARFGAAGAAIEGRDDSARAFGRQNVHPVVRVHPDTGRKALFVNEGWTTSIVELEPAESASLLRLLFEHVKSQDFNMRWTWKPNDLAFWDNRAVQHYAVPDYTGERVMQRVVLQGDVPVGPK